MIVFCLILFYNFFYLLCLVLKWFFWLKHTELGAWLNVLSFILVCANAWRERTNLLNYEGKEKKTSFFFWCLCRVSCLSPTHWDCGKERLFSFWHEGFSCNRGIFLAGYFTDLFVGLLFNHPHFMCIFFLFENFFLECKMSVYPLIYDVVYIQFKS